jgi:phosphoenolpyruvate carboxykinase (GTP)
MRVLKWIVDRVRGRGYGVESPIGYMPRHEDIHWEGLDFNPETFYEIMSVDRQESAKEARSHEELFDKFYDRLPTEFIHHRELFKSRLWRSPEVWELARDFF